MMIPLQPENQKKIRPHGSRKIGVSKPGVIVPITVKKLFNATKLPTETMKMKYDEGSLQKRLIEIASLRNAVKAMQITIVSECETWSLAIWNPTSWKSPATRSTILHMPTSSP